MVSSQLQDRNIADLRPDSSKDPWRNEAWRTLAFCLEWSMYPVSRKPRPHIQSSSRNTSPHIQSGSRVGLKATMPY
ncbi:hypothetical protein AVEN_217424-1, partial [Araneus ventricosus]